MSSLRRVWVTLALVIGVVWAPSAFAEKAQEFIAQADQLRSAPAASEASLQRAVALYEEAARLEPNSVEAHLKIADTALTMAAWTTGDRRPWFDRGLKAAQRAVVLDKDNAEALFLLAAHAGQIASLQKDLGGLLVPRELEGYLSRALALNPRHARALHMMAILLLKTPGPLRLSLKGKASDIEKYLIAATEADPNFSEAKLDLAEYYQSKGLVAQARAQARAVVQMPAPAQTRAWREKHRPAAEALLKKLPAE